MLSVSIPKSLYVSRRKTPGHSEFSLISAMMMGHKAMWKDRSWVPKHTEGGGDK